MYSFGSDRTSCSKSPDNVCQLTISKYDPRIRFYQPRSYNRQRKICNLLKPLMSYVLHITMTCKEKLIALST
jgi:hypothetical protein